MVGVRLLLERIFAMPLINNGINTTIEHAVVGLFPDKGLEAVADLFAVNHDWNEAHARANEDIRAHLIAEGVNFD